MRARLRDAWTVLRRAVAEAREDRLTTTAQALAFSLFLAIPATFLVALGLFSILADEGALEELVERAGAVLPQEAASLLEDSLRRTAAASGGGILMTAGGFLLALWTTTSAATTLMEALTRMFDRPDARSFLRKRLAALAIVASLVLGAALVLGLLVLGPHLQRWIGDALGAPSLVGWVWWTAQWPILLAGLLASFASILYLGPNVDHPRWRFLTPGALLAVAVWLAASGLFAAYTSLFGSYNKTWGTAAAVVVTLVWLWLSGLALLIGAEVNAEAERSRELRQGKPAERELQVQAKA